VLGIATAVTIVAQAWWLAQVLGDGFAGVGLGPLWWPLAGVAVAIAARAALGWAHEIAAARTAAQVKAQLRCDVMTAVLAPQPAAGGQSTGQLIALLGAGLDALDGYLGRYLPQLVLAVVVPLVVVVAVLLTDVTSAITIALTLPLIPLFMALIGIVTADRTQRRWQAMQRLAHHFTDVLSGLTTLKVFGRARSQVEGLRRVGEQHRSESMAALRWAFLSALVLELLATISVALVAVGIGLRLVHGGVDLRSALFVLLLAPEAYLPLRLVGTHFHDSAEGVAAAQDAFAVIAAAPPPRRGVAAPDLAQAEIVVDGVTVSYPGRTTPALVDGSLLVRPGETVALAGPSGCGKSTLLAVLLGLVEPSSGRVLVGGLELDEIDLASWRAQTAWVPQRPALLSGTVADNVSLGHPETNIDEVRAALVAAGAAELDPAGRVGDLGVGLSAGQQRRVGLARALLRVQTGRARLLLLDEPTAGLDAASEAGILDRLRKLNVTVVAVAHRRSLLAHADRVVQLAPPIAQAGV
jgi:ATP-binding cassette subfamily C protein CydD/ATP-binding cassette subfamily C protein CydCD